MSIPPPSPPDARASRRSRWLLAALAVVAVVSVIAMAALVWYILFRPAGPPPIEPGAPLIPESWLSGPAVLALAATVFA